MIENNKKTTVINLFGGPGAGKSTLACELFSSLKHRKVNTELVREYVKDWAWESRKINPIDQLYIAAKQFRREQILYGKVDVIITDSPIILSAVYEEVYSKNTRVWGVLPTYLSVDPNVKHLNFFIKRHKDYVQAGRYEDESQAKEIDKTIESFLINKNIPYTTIDCLDNIRSSKILDFLFNEGFKQ